MIAVIFEVIPAPGRKQEYLDLAAQLRPDLEKLDGFISIERFASLSDESKSCRSRSGRDEDAVSAGETLPDIAKRRRADAAACSPNTGCASRA